MKKILTTLLTATALITANADIVINEVYTGGGSGTGSPAYRTDYIELYNNGLTDVDISGYLLAYAPNTRAAGVFDVVIGTLPALSTIVANGYYLVQTGTSGTAGATDVTPNVDFNSGASLSNTAGAIRLQNSDATPLTLDIFGYGAVNNFEGTAKATTGVTTATSFSRTLTGVDTNNNNNDFTVGTSSPVGVPEPSTYAMIFGGLGIVAFAARRKSRMAA